MGDEPEIPARDDGAKILANVEWLCERAIEDGRRPLDPVLLLRYIRQPAHTQRRLWFYGEQP